MERARCFPWENVLGWPLLSRPTPSTGDGGPSPGLGGGPAATTHPLALPQPHVPSAGGPFPHALGGQGRRDMGRVLAPPSPAVLSVCSTGDGDSDSGPTPISKSH